MDLQKITNWAFYKALFIHCLLIYVLNEVFLSQTSEPLITLGVFLLYFSVLLLKAFQISFDQKKVLIELEEERESNFLYQEELKKIVDVHKKLSIEHKIHVSVKINLEQQVDMLKSQYDQLQQGFNTSKQSYNESLTNLKQTNDQLNKMLSDHKAHITEIQHKNYRLSSEIKAAPEKFSSEIQALEEELARLKKVNAGLNSALSKKDSKYLELERRLEEIKTGAQNI